MATQKDTKFVCPHCGEPEKWLEVKRATQVNANTIVPKLTYIICAHCKKIVGMVDTNLRTEVQAWKQIVQILEKKINLLEKMFQKKKS
jgi:phage terminase large subunit GpA-like protein